jgi:hypothetical protein
MLVKVLGIIDIFCSIVLIISSFFQGNISHIVGIYLICKGILFGVILGIGYGGLNFVSIIDAAIGVYLLLGLGVGFFNTVFFVFLLQKGIFSLF